jgi:hypothetical protein
VDRYDASGRWLLGADGEQLEICDQVGPASYWSGGIALSDFLLPEWFQPHHHGRLDYLGVLHPNGSIIFTITVTNRRRAR